MNQAVSNAIVFALASIGYGVAVTVLVMRPLTRWRKRAALGWQRNILRYIRDAAIGTLAVGGVMYLELLVFHSKTVVVPHLGARIAVASIPAVALLFGNVTAIVLALKTPYDIAEAEEGNRLSKAPNGAPRRFDEMM